MQLSLAVLILFALAVSISAFRGFHVPGPEQRVDPSTLAQEGPFAEPGLVERAPGRYEAYLLASTWEFTPPEVRIPAGSSVTFYLTSTDVQHGFRVEGTNINLMVLPGQVSKFTARFEKPGEYLFVCHEYCGVSHHEMAGKVIVEPKISVQPEASSQKRTER